MELRTRICDLLGVEHPIGNAGMAGVAHTHLCAAVAEAGGIGTLAMTSVPTADIPGRVAAVQAATNQPFSANFITWIVEQDPTVLDATLDTGVASITLSFGDPTPYVDRVHRAGALLMSQVQTLEAARQAVDAGADVIIAQGNEAGGHTGVMPLLPFLPQVVDAVGDVPVLAAGGIGDGRGLAAVLTLGAQGALMGTRFLASNEAESDWPELPNQVLAASADDTVWTKAIDIAQGGGSSLWPEGIGARSIRTPWLDRWASHEDQLTESIAGDIGAANDGIGDATPAYAGPVAGMVTQREAAGKIIESVIADAIRVLEANQRWLGSRTPS